MDEPVPIRRAAVGCLLIALAGLAVALIVRPAIFSFASPRDDSAVVVATAAGEIDAGDGRVQLRVIVAPGPFAGVTAVAAASPVSDDCPIEVAQVGLVDCEGRAWTLDGVPLESGLPPLDRFPVDVANGSVTVDLTRTIGD